MIASIASSLFQYAFHCYLPLPARKTTVMPFHSKSGDIPGAEEQIMGAVSPSLRNEDVTNQRPFGLNYWIVFRPR